MPRWPRRPPLTVLYKDEIFASDNIAAGYEGRRLLPTPRHVCSAAQLPLLPTVPPMPLAEAADVPAAAAAQALDMLASKRAARLAKKHGNITL